jgi:hypothetical protein
MTNIAFISFLFSIIYYTNAIGFVRPVEPLKAWFVNTQLPSIYSFHFKLDSGLSSTSYIGFTFPNYTTVTNPTCLFSLNTPNPSTAVTCQTVTNSIYILPAVQISATDEVYVTLSFSPVIPNFVGPTELVQVATTSSTIASSSIIYDTNNGYGQMVWQSSSTIGSLFLNIITLGNPATQSLQGASNSISVQIRFSKAFTSAISRLIIVLE